MFKGCEKGDDQLITDREVGNVTSCVTMAAMY